MKNASVTLVSLDVLSLGRLGRDGRDDGGNRSDDDGGGLDGVRFLDVNFRGLERERGQKKRKGETHAF